MYSTGAKTHETNEDTMETDDEEAFGIERTHRHYDDFCERTPVGTKFASAEKGLETLSRRAQSRLAVSRRPYLEPIGVRREEYYEQRIMVSLPWYAPHKPVSLESDQLEWTVMFDLRVTGLEPTTLALKSPNPDVSYEDLSKRLEDKICAVPHLICDCCLLQDSARCKACLYAVGYHKCEKQVAKRWRKGTLYAGQMDFQRIVWNLHRRGLPMSMFILMVAPFFS